MNLLRTISLLTLIILLAGCGSQPSRPGDGRPLTGDNDPTHPATLNAELGLAYMQRGNFELAMERLQRALVQNPRSAMAHHYIAELYRRLDEPDRAAHHFREAVALTPDDSSLRNNYGVFLCERGEYLASEEHFLAALHNPVFRDRVQTLENLGVCMQLAGRDDKARDYFGRALRIQANLPITLFSLAEITFQAGEADTAADYLRRHLAIASPTAESLWLGVRIERQRGNRDSANDYAAQLIESFPDAEQTQLLLRTR